MDLYEYLEAINEMMYEMEDNKATNEELDDLALTIFAVAVQMGWEITLEYR